MSFTVEDGSIVPNADSYATLAAARSYALDRGIVLSSVDATLQAELVKACDYIETFADQFVGSVVQFTQPLSWPRQGVEFDPDTPFPSNEIPSTLIAAQIEAVIAVEAGINLQPNVDYSQGGFVIRDKVGPLETQYSERIGTTSQPLLPKVIARLKPLLTPGVALRTIRV